MKKGILIFIVVVFSATFVWADEIALQNSVRIENKLSSTKCSKEGCNTLSKSIVVEETSVPKHSVIEIVPPASEKKTSPKSSDEKNYWELVVSCYGFGDSTHKKKFDYSYDCGAGVVFGSKFKVEDIEGFEYVLGAIIFSNKSGRDNDGDKIYTSAYGLKAGVNYVYSTNPMDLFVQVSRVATIVSPTTESNFPDLDLFENRVFNDTCLQIGGRLKLGITRISFGPSFCDFGDSGFTIGVGRSW